MPFRTMDDCFVPRHSHFSENIDYLCQGDISNLHLHLCWKENNSVSVKKSSDDISLQIPSSVSRRLENIAWRRLYKQIWRLDEASPAIINWNKNQDVTWLYGPKYSKTGPFDDVDVPLTQANLSKLAAAEIPDSAIDEVSSMNSGRSMSFDDRSSVESFEDYEEEDDEEEACGFELKSALKQRRQPFKKERKTKKKSVKFNYVVYSREFMNGHSIDYHYLDPSCL